MPAPSLWSEPPWRHASSRRALAMLTLLPIHSPVVPRVHVEPRHPNGTLRVLDRVTGEQLLVYTPRFTAQFRAGHRAGLWYVRPGNQVGIDLRSHGFATARLAVEAVTGSRWRRDAAVAGRTGLMPRVIWSDLKNGPVTAGRSQPRLRNPITDESLIEEQP